MVGCDGDGDFLKRILTGFGGTSIAPLVMMAVAASMTGPNPFGNVNPMMALSNNV